MNSTSLHTPLRTLLVDNHDSFTWNLVHDLTRVNGVEPVVVPNDWDRWDAEGRELLASVDNVVISPGPGTPLIPEDVGICPEVVRAAVASGIPVLGICLGHQLIAHMYGATVGPAPEPIHGRVSAVEHDGRDLFHGLPTPVDVVRYHSLAVSDVPSGMTVTAHADGPDGVVMGISVVDDLLWGVQFHPESVLSGHGRAIFANFAALTRTHGRARTVKSRVIALSVRDTRAFSGELFERLYGRINDTSTQCVWLDGNRENDPRARFSVMGASRTSVTAVASGQDAPATVTVCDADSGDGAESVETDIFTWLRGDLARRRITGDSASVPGCGFRLGWVGYLGYGLKADCAVGEGATTRHAARIPDAGLVLLERAIVIDHETAQAHLLTLDGAQDAAWQDHVAGVVREVQDAQDAQRSQDAAASGASCAVAVTLHGRADYTAKVREIQRLITAGETYEACLTTTLEVTSGQGTPDTLGLYRRLRADNPAPFGAYLRLPGVTVMSTSPERFLSVNADGRVTSSPIKGTRPVGTDAAHDDRIRAELRASEKDRAENLMIVDLVRHDLGRVAAPGTVEVPELFAVESYATVHQLVSTVTADLAAGRDGLDAVRAAFPPGSMTGAPKERTMRILDELEDGPRGVYSGAVGYLSLDGAVDLSVVIRTLVAEHGAEHGAARLTYGVGGAVVAQSSPDGEYDETVVKAAPVLRLCD
ncbi:aminodeoxychorismate synthase component I [Corynebacterium sp. AOP40-9SA-29]|uniref:aminodeoxychorismate synthase component I n=1 Tax=Corynebacterium sp. AOP40-9SA-29 TaxID=3457677 RepID=UPI0040346205